LPLRYHFSARLCRIEDIMDQLAAIDEQIQAIYGELDKIDAQIWAVCSPYEAYTAAQIEAMADKLTADAASITALEPVRDELHQQLDELYAAKDAALLARQLAEAAALTESAA
jgi:hypothetical protein